MKFFVAFFVAVTLGLASALTPEDVAAIRDVIKPIVLVCAGEFGVTKDDIMAAHQQKKPDSLNPCFYACVFKKTNALNSAGEFVPDTYVEWANKHITNPTSIQEITDVGKSCIEVNEKSVSDGEKGCERAKLLTACLVKQGAKFFPFAA